MNIKTLLLFVALLLSALPSAACTSAIVSGKACKSGNPLLWKHRDSSKSNNYVDTVSCTDHRFDYIALFNADDSAKLEAWAGVNRSGFAIINTVAGNLKKNKPDWTDREGYVMSHALKSCITVNDFARLLDSLPKPLGVRTNFGVLDSSGNGAYFETDDYGYRRYDLNPVDKDVVIRSNFSYSASPKGGYGYDRFDNARARLIPAAKEGSVTPELMTESLSRDFFSKSKNVNFGLETSEEIKDEGFIPRPTSVSSVVIELSNEGPVMWTMLGFPPVAVTMPVTVDFVPVCLKRNPLTGRSDACDEAILRKSKILNKDILQMPETKAISEQMKAESLDNYENFRKKND